MALALLKGGLVGRQRHKFIPTQWERMEVSLVERP